MHTGTNHSPTRPEESVDCTKSWGWERVPPTTATAKVSVEEAALRSSATLYLCWPDSCSPSPIPHRCCSNLSLLPLQPNLPSLRRHPHFLLHGEYRDHQTKHCRFSSFSTCHPQPSSLLVSRLIARTLSLSSSPPTSGPCSSCKDADPPACKLAVRTQVVLITGRTLGK